MTETLTMMAILLVAIVWIIRQEMILQRANKRLDDADAILGRAKEVTEALVAENQLLKAVLTDVAKGEADVWIEDGEVRATKLPAGETPIH
jgi:hypothetical protein